jgi:hypothetical protein
LSNHAIYALRRKRALHEPLSDKELQMVEKVFARLSLIFNKGKWQGGYGGKAWGSIADCLLALVTGEYSPEMFCDLAFALQQQRQHVQ